MAEELEERPEVLTEEDAWAMYWQLKKNYMIKKVKERKEDWYKRATSDEAEKDWANGVQEAAKEKRRAKALKQVSPDDWASDVEAGVKQKVITEKEKKEWAKRSAPYRELVKLASRLFKKYNIEGRDAMRLWERINFEILKPAKGAPEKIPALRQKLISIIEEYLRGKGITVEVQV